MKRRFVTGPVIGLMFGLIMLAQSADAGERERNFRTSHMTGIRLGAWIHQGPEVPERLEQSGTVLETNVNAGSAFFEGFFAYRFSPVLLGEVAAGVASRGTVKFQNEFGDSDVGNLMVYPITLALRVYPLIQTDSRLQPFLLGGGGLYWGRRSVQFSTNIYNVIYPRDKDSQTDFNFLVGGGVDYLAFDKFAIGLTAKYMPINFSDNLINVSDYSALAITIGVKYLYQPAKH